MPWRRAILFAAVVAALTEATSWRDLEPDAVAAALYTVSGVGLLALGVFARWRGLVAFIPAFLAAAVAEETFLYEPGGGECDPFCSSPLSGSVFVVPFYALCIAAAAVLRTFMVKRRAGRPPISLRGNRHDRSAKDAG